MTRCHFCFAYRRLFAMYFSCWSYFLLCYARFSLGFCSRLCLVACMLRLCLENKNKFLLSICSRCLLRVRITLTVFHFYGGQQKRFTYTQVLSCILVYKDIFVAVLVQVRSQLFFVFHFELPHSIKPAGRYERYGIGVENYCDEHPARYPGLCWKSLPDM